MEELIVLIGNLGFPIAVSAYLLVRFEKKIDILNESIEDLNILIEKKMK